MKKIQREETVVVRKEVYVSVDGKEFENEKDCMAWESSYRGTLNKSWELMKKHKASPCGFGIPYCNEDDECYIVKPASLDEITLINAYISASTYDNRVTLTTNHIGKLVFLNFGYDHDYCSEHILADNLAKITECIAKVEAEFNEEKEEA